MSTSRWLIRLFHRKIETSLKNIIYKKVGGPGHQWGRAEASRTYLGLHPNPSASITSSPELSYALYSKAL
jgi:hypothetical protein